MAARKAHTLNLLRKARFFELGKGCIVFHNYPDEAALKVLL
jgi:hypothetical protein